MTAYHGDTSTLYIGVCRVIVLMVFLFIFLLCGGLLFQHLEQDFKLSELYSASVKLEQHKAELLKTLWANALISGEDEWMELAGERIDFYERQTKRIMEKFSFSASEWKENPWTFVNSLFYAFTLITTIGFGNITPETQNGRLVTVVYGMIGIPLAICLLDEVGKILANLFRRVFCASDLKLGFYILIFTMATGTFFFSYFEELCWVDAWYLSFVTFSSVGFGDIVPARRKSFMYSILYIACCLAMLSTCFSLWKSYIDLATLKMLKLILGKSFNTDPNKPQQMETPVLNSTVKNSTDAETEYSRIPTMNSGIVHRHTAKKNVFSGSDAFIEEEEES